jgi:hypothetical protein
MQMEFGKIFASNGCGTGKPQYERTVEAIAVLRS